MHRGCRVAVLDVGTSPALRERAEALTRRGVEVHLEWNEATWPHSCDMVVISPGVPDDSLLGRLAHSLGCPVIGELEYGFRHCSCPILAVTGTNGKTTTVELLTHCLRHAGRKVIAAGNIGKPLCEVVRKSASLEFLVVEVSSFQLEHIESFAPLVAAIVNITPDHLDRHGDMANYTAAKLRILANVKRACCVVLGEQLAESETVRAALPKDGSAPIVFSGRESLFADFFVANNGAICWRSAAGMRNLLPSSALRLEGRHNLENVLAMLAVGHAAGIEPPILAAHVPSFVPQPHRLELVTASRGVRFVNDSKATNIDAMTNGILSAAETTSGKILLIAGGVDKGIDFSPAAALLGRCVREVFLIGRCRERLAKQWGHVVSCKMFSSLAAAVDAAAEIAQPGDTVLLSPGCASQDMFVDYAERGRDFCALVKRRTGE